MIWSSWFWPLDDAPLGDMTPSTLKTWFRMRSSCPVGSSSPNSVSATLMPSRQTLVPAVTSASVKNAPDFIGQVLIFW